jgi:hypothetical protein
MLEFKYLSHTLILVVGSIENSVCLTDLRIIIVATNLYSLCCVSIP